MAEWIEHAAGRHPDLLVAAERGLVVPFEGRPASGRGKRTAERAELEELQLGENDALVSFENDPLPGRGIKGRQILTGAAVIRAERNEREPGIVRTALVAGQAKMPESGDRERRDQ